MRLAIVAFALMALTGAAYAQDDNGDGNNGVASSAATASDDASSELAACLPSGVTAAGAKCTPSPSPGAAKVTPTDPKPTEDPYGMQDAGPPSPGALEVLNQGNGQTRV